MSQTYDNDLELQDEGADDWDTALRNNFRVLERGFHVRASAAAAISSGQICIVTSAQKVVPYDARSVGLAWPSLMAWKNVSSGASATFVREGIVRSMAVWSGKIIPGEPVFAAPNSLGFAVSSYAGAAYPAGVAIGADAIWFCPGRQFLPERTTQTVSVGPVLVNSYGDFAMSLGNRGYASLLRVNAQSADAFKVQFWSGSARVNSEQLYNTLTRSTSVGSVDVTSRGYTDGAGFPWFNTDTASPALVFGRLTVQSGSSVSSSNFSVQVVLERFR